MDGKGGIYFVCSFTSQTKTAAAKLPPGTGAAPLPINSPPALHSRPGATKILFLDFNGAIITNTEWNTSEGVASWTCLPFDTDGNTNTFSDAEQSYIRQCWERVAEDYAPFNVDVTTEQPPTWNAQIAHASK